MRFFFVLLSAVTLAHLFAIPLMASAQSSQGDLRLITSPLPINLTTEPGTTASTQLRIKNDGGETEKLHISLMKFKAFGETGAPRLLEPELNDAFLSWATFPENDFLIDPQEWKTIDMRIEVPQSAAFGYYYAVVFSRADEKPNLEEKQTALVGGTAILVLLDVRVADAKREIEVVQFSADRKMYEFLPATFTVRVKNTGNVHIAPFGNIFVGKGNKKDVAKLDVNQGEGRGNVLPDSYREFQMRWDDGFPIYRDRTEDDKVIRDEQGNIIRELVWDWKDAAKLRFGKYQAKLVLVYDDGRRDVPIEGVVEFWVLPWRVMGGVLLNFVIILWLIWYVMRLRSRLKKIQSTPL